MNHYIHHVPGRLRIKSNQLRCPGDHALEALRRLNDLEGVREVTFNRRATSITVHYDPAKLGQPRLLEILQQAGCVGPGRYRGTESAPGGGVFTRALVGALAQTVAQRSVQTLVGALL
ncbi:HMA2 domain-containing protein [Endothiovibrio diazotrophicus]